MLGGRDQLFALGVVVLSAKLAKCDGVVTREEIDAFKRQFRIPPEAVRDVGRMFDTRRGTVPRGSRPMPRQLGDAFADAPGVLEDVLAALVRHRARGQAEINAPGDWTFLQRVHRRFNLGAIAWDRASGAAPRFRPEPTDDAYSRDWRAPDRHRRRGAGRVEGAWCAPTIRTAWLPAACRRSSSPAPPTRWPASTPPGTGSSASEGCDARGCQ